MQLLLVTPDKYRVKLTTLIHITVGGHLGVTKTVTAIRKLGYWWPGMHRTARHVIKQCRGCQFAATRMNSNLASDASRYVSIPQHKWDEVSIDHCGPFPVTAEGYNYLLVVMDNFSKFLVVIPTVGVEAATTARALFYEVFMTYGFPERILSDRGQAFLAPIMMDLYTLFDIHKMSTSPYRPQNNGKMKIVTNSSSKLSRSCVKRTLLFGLLVLRSVPSLGTSHRSPTCMICLRLRSNMGNSHVCLMLLLLTDFLRTRLNETRNRRIMRIMLSIWLIEWKFGLQSTKRHAWNLLSKLA